jgi:hypothetical protein
MYCSHSDARRSFASASRDVFASLYVQARSGLSAVNAWWQANRRANDPTPDGDVTEMDFDEFEFALEKICTFCKVLWQSHPPRAAP